MKELHFRDNFKNFLYDLDEFISLYDNNIHIFNYRKLNKINEKEIIVSFDKMTVNICGDNLKLKQMTKQELLINGSIQEIKFSYV